ncbi:MAG: type IV secretion system protein [Gammaproteobacteria bacterium]|nr:type IV secretion system protein [Gammaproteobacteria bacterium]
MLDFQRAIVSSIFECVDRAGADLVAHTYHNLVNQYAVVMWVFVTLFVSFNFIQAMQGQKSFYDLLNVLFRIVIIMTLALNYDYFCLFIYDIFTNEPLMIMKAITINGTDPSITSINQALDNYLNLGLKAANQLFMMGGWHNVAYLIFSGLVFIMTVICGIIAAGLIILAKCAIVILLALSPIFLFFAIFEMTKGMFEAYVRHLFTYALIPILISAILMILLSVTNVVIQFMNQYSKMSFTSITPFLFMSGIQIYLLAQVFSKASALGSGFALKGFVSTMSQMKDSATTFTRAMGGNLGKAVLTKAVAMTASSHKGTSSNAARMNRFNKE